MDQVNIEAPRQADLAAGFVQSSYAELPDRFYQRADLSPVRAPKLIRLNRQLAEDLNLDIGFLESEGGIAVLAGNASVKNVQPLALAYAGHQFGNFVPQLGDGRALLIGEAIDRGGKRRDIQLKGSGRTRFSRGGDGRAALGPVLREYVVSEAMAALGIPTTRALAAVSTGEMVFREGAVPGAIFTRVAASHLRIGTFQYFAARGDHEALKALADYAIERHYSEAAAAETPYLALLENVVAAQARLVARWMLVGFIHGVMNTDNMSISGETIDYGPCAFMDSYHPGTVFSSIDAGGRYAYANQPRIAVWNLARLAEAMLPLLAASEDEAVALAEAVLKKFQATYDGVFHKGLRRKLGLSAEHPEDLPLAAGLLEVMSANEADFTLVFRGLGDDFAAVPGEGGTRKLFKRPEEFDGWAVRWKERLAREPEFDVGRQEMMRSVNPKYIPRNHRVEEVIRAAVDRSDFSPFEELLSVLARPFDEQPAHSAYVDPPKPEERVLETFCGT
ncbi:protein adenylyltransferase SelO [Mesorhizobium sp. CN2-181]|uniref:protein adenylyltransferase SelO n=1 Tax=Mesorhizobium yinganensis TaxID=3157707 RepID=UPI0032B868EB